MIKVIFPAAAILVFNTIAFRIPRRLTAIEIYASIFFTMCLQMVTDITLDLRFDLYRTLDKGPDLLAFLVFFGIYPAMGYIFLNFFPFSKSLRIKVMYILFFTVFATIFEWLSLKAGYFTHVKWKLWYSALCDLFIFAILSGNLVLIRKLIKAEYIIK